jgi:hypothetical protein
MAKFEDYDEPSLAYLNSFYGEGEESLGLSGARPRNAHQRVSRNLIHFLMKKVNYRLWEPMVESHVADTQGYIPDIFVFHRLTGEIHVIIEICRSNYQEKADIEKINDFFHNPELKQYNLQEGFIYNYQTDQWRKFTASGEIEYNRYYSDTLQLNFTDGLVARKNKITLDYPRSGPYID